MKKISSSLLYYILRLYAFFPLTIMYFFSDIFLYPIVYYVIGYRLKVVRRNLKNSFPEKSGKELRLIERRFYHYFCDTFQETVKILNLNEKDGKERMIFRNPEVVEEFVNKGQGVLLVLGHYGNWEYQTFLSLYLPNTLPPKGFNVYRPLKNKSFDYLYLKIRAHFGAINIPKNGAYRTIIRLRQEKKASVFGLVSDQSPSEDNLHYWTNFLNQDTSILTGPERMAKQTGYAVVYADVQRIGRGYYQTVFEIITDKPKETQAFEITEKYARLMEKTILRDPAFWLWTHKRWKHKHTV